MKCEWMECEVVKHQRKIKGRMWKILNLFQGVLCLIMVGEFLMICCYWSGEAVLLIVFSGEFDGWIRLRIILPKLVSPCSHLENGPLEAWKDLCCLGPRTEVLPSNFVEVPGPVGKVGISPLLAHDVVR